LVQGWFFWLLISFSVGMAVGCVVGYFILKSMFKELGGLFVYTVKVLEANTKTMESIENILEELEREISEVNGSNGR